MKKFLRFLLYGILGVLLIAIIYISILFPPVMGGMAAKTVCSCMYVSGRTQQSVVDKELQVFPGLDKFNIQANPSDSSVTASLLWHSSKAIFRKGVGCTLLSEKDEAEIQNQKFNLAAPPSATQDSIEWPTGDLHAESDFSGIDRAAIEKSVNEAFADLDPENPVYTHAVVAVYKG